MSTQTTSEGRTVFGFWLYLLSDSILFAGLFATFAVLRTAGPPPYVGDFFDLPFVLAETLILLLSSFTMGLATVYSGENVPWEGLRSSEVPRLSDFSAEKSRTRRGYILVALTLTFLLGLSFVGLELSEFAKLIAQGAGPAHSAALSAFFVLVGTHGLHVALGSLWMLVVILHLLVRPARVLTKLRTLALFWHFLDIIWIFIFTIVYLFGAL